MTVETLHHRGGRVGQERVRTLREDLYACLAPVAAGSLG